MSKCDVNVSHERALLNATTTFRASAEQREQAREAMQMALEYVSWHAFGDCRLGSGPIPEASDVVVALRAAMGVTR